MTPVDLGQPLLLSLLGGGFLAAFLHSALPTHWLPFVLVGRAQGWSLARVLGAAVAAGLAHVAVTGVVGGAIILAGLALSSWIEGLLPRLAAGLLLVFGAFYLVRASIRRPALAGGPAAAAGVVPGADLPEPAVSHAAAFWGLVGLMAASPGEVLLPLYMSAADQGAMGLGLLSAVLAGGTVLGMALLITAAWAGASMLRLERWARYEGAVLGVALIALGLMMIADPH